jgi:hypothetical protein
MKQRQIWSGQISIPVLFQSRWRLFLMSLINRLIILAPFGCAPERLTQHVRTFCAFLYIILVSYDSQHFCAGIGPAKFLILWIIPFTVQTMEMTSFYNFVQRGT